ncbi:MAG: hypothetical protein ACM3WU_03265 [Bacillota bacterium]
MELKLAFGGALGAALHGRAWELLVAPVRLSVRGAIQVRLAVKITGLVFLWISFAAAAVALSACMA